MKNTHRNILNITKYAAVSVLAVAAVIALNVFAGTWKTPATSSDLPAPVNLGPIDQLKTGGLVTGGSVVSSYPFTVAGMAELEGGLFAENTSSKYAGVINQLLSVGAGQEATYDLYGDVKVTDEIRSDFFADYPGDDLCVSYQGWLVPCSFGRTAVNVPVMDPPFLFMNEGKAGYGVKIGHVPDTNGQPLAAYDVEKYNFTTNSWVAYPRINRPTPALANWTGMFSTYVPHATGEHRNSVFRARGVSSTGDTGPWAYYNGGQPNFDNVTTFTVVGPKAISWPQAISRDVRNGNLTWADIVNAFEYEIYECPPRQNPNDSMGCITDNMALGQGTTSTLHVTSNDLLGVTKGTQWTYAGSRTGLVDLCVVAKNPQYFLIDQTVQSDIRPWAPAWSINTTLYPYFSDSNNPITYRTSSEWYNRDAWLCGTLNIPSTGGDVGLGGSGGGSLGTGPSGGGLGTSGNVITR